MTAPSLDRDRAPHAHAYTRVLFLYRRHHHERTNITIKKMAAISGHSMRHIHSTDEAEIEEHREILASLPPTSARELDMELGMLLTGYFFNFVLSPQFILLKFKAVPFQRLAEQESYHH